jgi:hypothetical protein
MGEDGYCADQTGYVCGNPLDDPLLDIRGMADTLVPKEESTVAVQRKRTQLLARNSDYAQNPSMSAIARPSN